MARIVNKGKNVFVLPAREGFKAAYLKPGMSEVPDAHLDQLADNATVRGWVKLGLLELHGVQGAPAAASARAPKDPGEGKPAKSKAADKPKG